jgi:RNA polymerase sigma factor (TIGR02999 family)
MRQILIDHAKWKQRGKRGGVQRRMPLEEIETTLVAGGDLSECAPAALIALDDALRRLERQNDRQSRIVECRFFGGMTVEDTADALDVSPVTVKRGWAMAQAWLHRELSLDDEESP